MVRRPRIGSCGQHLFHPDRLPGQGRPVEGGVAEGVTGLELAGISEGSLDTGAIGGADRVNRVRSGSWRMPSTRASQPSDSQEAGEGRRVRFMDGRVGLDVPDGIAGAFGLGRGERGHYLNCRWACKDPEGLPLPVNIALVPWRHPIRDQPGPVAGASRRPAA